MINRNNFAQVDKDINRRFLFYLSQQAFDKDKDSIKDTQIAFIASPTPMIYTHGTMFNCEDNSTAIAGLNNYIVTTTSNITDALTNGLTNLLNQINAINGEHANAIQEATDLINDAKDKIQNAWDRINEIANSSSASAYAQRLEGIIRNLEGIITGYSEFKEEINTELATLKQQFEAIDVENSISAWWTNQIDVLAGLVIEAIGFTNTEEYITSIVGREIDAFRGTLQDYVKWTLLRDSGYSSSLAEILLNSTEIGSTIAALASQETNQDGLIRLLYSALNLSVIDGQASWSLKAVADTENYTDHPLLAAIIGWINADTDQSYIHMTADKIGVVAESIGITDLKGRIGALETGLNNTNTNITHLSKSGITISHDVEKDGKTVHNRLLLQQNENGEFSGLVHWAEQHPDQDGDYYKDRYNGNDGGQNADVDAEKKSSAFALSVDGSGHLGTYNETYGDFPISWDADGNVTIHTKDGNGNSSIKDGTGTIVDIEKLGGYYSPAFTYSSSKPTLPSSGENFTTLSPNQFSSGVYTWYRSVPDSHLDGLFLWMITGLFNSDGNFISGETWKGPYQISGPLGRAGEDADGINFIFCRTGNDNNGNMITPNNYSNGGNLKTSSANYTNGDWATNANVCPIDKDNPYQWMSFSTLKNNEDTFINYSDPILWSRWGHDGIDGDGVEYIFYKSNTDLIWKDGSNNPIDPIDSTRTENNSINPAQWTTAAQNQTTNRNFSDYDFYMNGWTDDPLPLNVGDVEYVSMRKSHDGVWGAFSMPAEWARLGRDAVASGYIMHVTNPNAPVFVDENGAVTDQEYYGGTGVQIFENGTRIQSLSEIFTTNTENYKESDLDTTVSSHLSSTTKYFVITCDDTRGHITSPHQQAPSNITPWYNTTVGYYPQNGSNFVGNDICGNYLQINIKKFGDPESYSPALSLTYPIDISDGHGNIVSGGLKYKLLQLPIVASIYEYDYSNQTNTKLVDIESTFTVYGIYTGADGASGSSIELVVSPTEIAEYSDGTVSNNSFITYSRIFENGEFFAKGPADLHFKIEYKKSGDQDWTRIENNDSGYNQATVQLGNDLAVLDALPIQVRLLYVDTANNISRKIDDEEIKLIGHGQNGEQGQSSIKSIIFTRINVDEHTAVLLPRVEAAGSSLSGNSGTYSSPVPTGDYAKVLTQTGTDPVYTYDDVVWSDGIPQGEELVWASTRTFVSGSGSLSTDALWSIPVPMTDTETWDIEFAREWTGEGLIPVPEDGENGNRHGCVPSTNQIWFDPIEDSNVDFSEMVWRAEREKRNGDPVGNWTILRIKGERGRDNVAVALSNPSDLITVNESGNTINNNVLYTEVTLYDGSPIAGGSGSSITVSADSLFNTTAQFYDISAPTPAWTNFGTPTQYYYSGMKIGWVIPSGTNINADGEANITITYNNVLYSAKFTVKRIIAPKDAELPIKYQIHQNRKDLTYKAQRNGSDITYTAMCDTIELSLMKEQNSVSFVTNTGNEDYCLAYGPVYYDGSVDIYPTDGVIFLNEGLSGSSRKVESGSISGIGDLTTTKCVSENDLDFTFNTTDIQTYHAMWFKLYKYTEVSDVKTVDTEVVWDQFIAHATIIPENGSDGSSTMIDLDNESAVIQCDSEGIVQRDTTLITRLRLYTVNGQTAINRVEGTIPVTIDGLAIPTDDPEDEDYIDADITLYNDTDSDGYYLEDYSVNDPFVRITFDIVQGTKILYDRSELVVRLSYDGDIYSKTFTVLTTTFGTIYLLNPSDSSVIFTPRENGGYNEPSKTLTCGYKITSLIGTQLKSYADLSTDKELDLELNLSLVKEGIYLYYKTSAMSNFKNYNSGVIIDPNNLITSCTFALSTVDTYTECIDDTKSYSQREYRYINIINNAIDTETIPVFYTGKDGKDGNDGKDADNVSFVYKTTDDIKADVVNIQYDDFDRKITGNIALHPELIVDGEQVSITSSVQFTNQGVTYSSSGNNITIEDVDPEGGYITARATYGGGKVAYFTINVKYDKQYIYKLGLSGTNAKGITLNRTTVNNVTTYSFAKGTGTEQVTTTVGGETVTTTKAKIHVKLFKGNNGQDLTTEENNGIRIHCYHGTAIDVNEIDIENRDANTAVYDYYVYATPEEVVDGIMFRVSNTNGSQQYVFTNLYVNTSIVDVSQGGAVNNYRFNITSCYASYDVQYGTFNAGCSGSVYNGDTKVSISTGDITIDYDGTDHNISVSNDNFSWTASNVPLASAPSTLLIKYPDQGLIYTCAVTVIPENGLNGQNGTDGAAGSPGPMYYMMGNYNYNYDSYTRTSERIPLVYFNGSDDNAGYYSLKADSSYRHAPGQHEIGGAVYNVYDTSGNDSNHWQKETDFDVVISKAIFADFAKFGSAVISGDYILSTQGKKKLVLHKGEEPIVLDSTYNDYTMFCPDSPKENVTGKTSESGLTLSNGQYKVVANRVYVNYEQSHEILVNITFVSSTGYSNLGQILLFDSSDYTTQYLSYNNVTTSNSTSGSIDISVGILHSGWYYIIWKNTTGSSLSFDTVNYSYTTVGGDYNNKYYFSPNWYTDLKTGKMVAAGGNFICNSDGSVTAAGGNFVVDSSGNLNISGSFQRNGANESTIENIIYKHNVLYWKQGVYDLGNSGSGATGYFTSTPEYKITGQNGQLVNGGTIGATYNGSTYVSNSNVTGGDASYNTNGSLASGNIKVACNADIIFAETRSNYPADPSADADVYNTQIALHMMDLWIDDAKNHKNETMLIKCKVGSGQKMYIHTIGASSLIDVDQLGGNPEIEVTQSRTINLMSLYRTDGWHWVIL